MARVICLGIAVRDMVFRVAELPLEPRKLTASGLERTGGGMAASAAVTAARLGGEVSLWCRLGDDTDGDALRAELEQHGVAVLAERHPNTRTPTSAVLVADNGERLLVVYRGELDDSPAALPLAEVKRAQAVLVDFRWPRGAAALLGAARAAGVPSVLDADVGDPEAVAALLPMVDHAVFSEAGLLQAAGAVDVERALRAMHERGPAVTAVTLGERGSVFLIDGQLVHVGAVPVPARDTNGAGDAFHGAYALAIAEGARALDAARFASAAAALKCRNGTGWAAAPERAAVEQLMHYNR
jgi:sulfofructose kinase